MEEIKKYLDNGAENYQEGVLLFAKYAKNKNLKNLFARKNDSITKKKLVFQLHKLIGETKKLNDKQIKAVKRKMARELAKKEKIEKTELITSAKEKFADVNFDDKKTIAELKEQIAELESQTQEHQDDIDELKDKTNGLSNKLDGVANTDAKRPRIVDNPLVDVKELPDELQRIYFEHKEDVKRRGILHEKAKNATSDDDRKEYINKVAKLDDKIADDWGKIDNWWKNRYNKTESSTKKTTPVTQLEIDAWEDIEERTIFKQKRIKANINYIKRFAYSKKEYQLKEVEVRKAELDAWEITYTIPAKGNK